MLTDNKKDPTTGTYYDQCNTFWIPFPSSGTHPISPGDTFNDYSW